MSRIRQWLSKEEGSRKKFWALIAAYALFAMQLVFSTGVRSAQAAVPPTFRAAATATGSGGASLVINVPTGTALNDLMLTQITLDSGGASVTPPAGWIYLRDDGNGGIRQYVYYRVATASEPASYTWGISAGISSGATASFVGVDPFIPIHAHSGQAVPGSGTITAPSLNTTLSDVTLVGLFGHDDGLAIDPPPSMIERWDVASTQTTTQGSSEVFSSPGATGSRVATTAGGSNDNVGQLVALTPAGGTISGTVFEDIAGNLLAGGEAIGDAANPGRPNVPVYLYEDDGDGIPESGEIAVGSTTTAASGAYLFTGLDPAKDYWVFVDSAGVSASAGYNPTYTAASARPEQTYGPRGSWCADASAWGTTVQGAAAEGACFGGRRVSFVPGSQSDDISSWWSGAEHLSYIDLDAGLRDDVNFGFSFNVVASNQGNTAGSAEQGSFDQFLQNANAVAGPNPMRFVPAGPTNAAAAGANWWLISPTAALTEINDADTTVDGAAFNFEGTTRNDNPLAVGTGGTVGVDAIAFAEVPGSELQIDGQGLVIIDDGAAGLVPHRATIRALSITEAGAQAIRVNAISQVAPVADDIVLDELIIGMPPVWQPQTLPTGTDVGIHLNAVNRASVQDSFVGWTNGRTLNVETSTDAVIRGNEFRDTSEDVIDIYEGSTGTLFEQNRVSGGLNWGLDITVSSNTTLRNNTVDSSGDGVGQTGAVRLFGPGSIIDRNVFSNNAGPAIAIAGTMTSPARAAGEAVITRNHFLNNDGLGIDLQAASEDNSISGDGITPNNGGATDLSHGNHEIDFPVITAAGLTGGTTTVQGTACAGCTIEIYKAVGGTGDDDPPGSGTNYHGEGVEYLGSGVAPGGAFSIDVTGLVVGDSVSATATDTGAGVTSEFAQNLAVVAWSSISGRLFEDLAADALAGAQAIGDAANPVVAGVDVYLYADDGTTPGSPDAGDSVLNGGSPVSTDGTGAFSFASLPNGTYWVVADSATMSPGAGLEPTFAVDDVWAEQTYGPAGAWCADGTGGTGEAGAAGTCYGGRSGTASDQAAALTSAEHLARVVIAGGSPVADVDFGFSYDVVTSTRGGGATVDPGAAGTQTVQGSLRQFIANASNITGANQMRFVPAVATNGTDGTNNWWRVAVTSSLPAIVDAFTTIDGTAYQLADGITVRDDNNADQGAGETVGVDGLYTTPVLDPELELDITGPTNGLLIEAADTTVRDIGIWGADSHDIAVGDDLGPTFAGVLIEQNIVGTPPHRFDGSFAPSGNDLIELYAEATDGIVRDNLIGFSDGGGVSVDEATGGWLVFQNEIRGTGRAAGWGAVQDAVGDAGTGTVVRGNLLVDNAGMGVDSHLSPGGYTIEQNTIRNNGTIAPEEAGVRVIGSGSTVTKNLFEQNNGPAIIIVSDDASAPYPGANGNRISQNHFSNSTATADNAGIAVDLLDAASPSAEHDAGDGITLNDGATDPDAGNLGLDYPVITSASIVAGSSLIVTGWARPGAELEFYEAAGTANDQNGAGTAHGEGFSYLFTGVEGSGGDSDPATGSYSDPDFGSDVAAEAFSFSVALPAGISAGDEVSAIAIDGANNTSEFGPNRTVVVANTPPTFDQDLGDRSHGEGQSISLPSPATDPDGDPLTYSAVGLPPGLSIDTSTGLISGTVDPESEAAYAVTITVDDTISGTDVDTFTWTITQGIALISNIPATSNDLLTWFNPDDVSPVTNEQDIGTGTGTTPIKGMDADPGIGTLYAAAGAQLGIIDGVTGVWAAVGAFGSGDGVQGTVLMDDINALSFHPITAELYAVQNRSSDENDLLFLVDPATGALIFDVFGAGVDYVEIENLGARSETAALAIHPTTGVAYIGLGDDSGSQNQRIATLDLTTGATSTVGDTDPPIILGMAFAATGELLGVGFDRSTPNEQYVYDIDISDASTSNPRRVDNGENYQSIATPLPLTAGIYGAVFEDVAGDALAGGSQVVGDAGNPMAPGTTVRLYRDDGSTPGEPDATDSLVGSTATDAFGNYEFKGIPDGDYWVAVDSATVAPSAGIDVAHSQDDVWAEQTYGPEGSLSFDGVAAYSVTAQRGPFYGGKQGDVSDSAATLLDAEHVASVGLAGVANVNNDFGFSFNVVTSTRGGDGVPDPGATGNRTVQGSLRQFLANSNAVTGANTSRFVPAMPTNGTDGGGNDWWRIDVTAALPLVTDANTTIDGRPYMPDGVSGRNDNGAAIGTGGLVGVGNIYATPTLDPELEIRGDDVVGTGIELAPTADGSTITNVAVARFNFESVELSGLVADAIDSITIENAVFGAKSPADFTFDPAAPVSSGITADFLTNGTIRSNLFRVTNQAMHLEYASTDNLIQANETRGANTGIYLKGSATDQPARTTIRGNAFMESGWWGVRMYQNVGDHTVAENTISLGGNYGIDLSGTTHTVSGNIVTSNGAEAIRGSAPLIDADITQNEFGGNGELAIDLGGDGITLNDDGDIDAGPNAAINYPIVTSAYLLGGNLIVSGYARAGDRIEFYESVGAANDNNTSGTPHGEGVGYLLTATEGVADGDPDPASYTDPGYGTDTTAEGFSFTVPAPIGLALGEQISAISYQGGVGTSEFGPSVTVTIPPGSVSGMVFEDVAGNVLSGPETIGDAANPVVPGAEVRVYEDTNGNNIPDAGDALVAGPILTDAGGNYSVTSLFNGVTYWVTVDSTTIAPTAGIHAAYSATTPWAEQSYGPDDALCADGLGGSSYRVGAGPCYGGQAAGTADAAGALATAQHVARVVPSGAETGIDFGFSYNVVTHTAAAFGPTLDASSDQGSLDQFVRNANAILGGNAMRFVPAVPANGGAAEWWRIDYSGTAIGDQVENVHDADTTIDGTAFSLADGTTVLNSNAGFLGANAGGGVTVGVDDVALPQVARPELELVRTDGGTGSGFNFYHWTPTGQTPDNLTVRDLAISGFAQGISSSGIAAGRPTGVTFERIVVGSGPDAFTDPGYAGTLGGVSIIQADDGFIRNSLLGFFENNAIVVSGSDGWTISGNEVRDAAQIDAISDGINHGGGTSNGLISANLVVDSGGMGIDGTMTGTTVTNNTITGSGQLATQTAAIRFNDGPNSATRNVLTGNIGPGIIITDSAQLVTIVENRYGDNGGPAIDLVAAGGDTATGDGISLNDGTLLGDSSVANQCGTVVGDGNDGFDSPVITTADWALGTTTITGLACPGSTVQVYEALAGAGDTLSGTDYGEGILDELTQVGPAVVADGAGNWTFSTNALSVGDNISSISTDPAGNTSEFGANVAVTTTIAITGTIFEDQAGDALAGVQTIGDAANPFESGVRIELFRDGGDGIPDGGDDTYIGFTVSALADGTYSFSGLPPDVYWVTVDSQGVFDGPINPGYAAADAWAEQTYGPVGAASFDGSSWSFDAAAGPHYGGARWDVSDDFAPTSSLPGADHIARADLTGGPVTNVDFGFSFNVVTTTRGATSAQDPGAGGGLRTVQGSLRQFLTNANAQSDSNTMRFVPAAPINDGTWWEILVTDPLPAIDDVETNVDGTAYDAADGVTVRDTTPGYLGANAGGGVTVGVDGLALNQVERPELEIQGDQSAALPPQLGLEIIASSVTVRELAIYGFGDTGTAGLDSDIRVGPSVTPLEGIVLDRLVIGTAPGAFADPGPGVRSQGTGIRITDAVSGGGLLDNVITDSLIGHNRSTGVLVNTNTGGWIVSGNEIRATGTNPSSGRPDGLSVEGTGSTSHVITANLIVDSSRVGIETWRSSGGHSIVNNDIISSSTGFSDETAGVRLAGPGNLVSKNRINGGTGPGIVVIGENTASPHVASINNLISQNEFGSNTGLAIDLVAATTVSAPHSTGDGLTLTPGTDPGTGNIGVDAPVITSASTTSVSGTACVGCTVEVYRAISGAGDGGYGEGVEYAGSAVVGGGGTFTAAVAGVGTDDEVSAITIDPSNNTSEFGANLAVNTPPVLDPVGDRTVDEQTALGFTATASDPDSGDTLTFSLSGAPAGASITPGGVFSWTPTEAQGPGSYVFDVVVTDDATPAGSDSETITVTVDEVNVAPVLDPVGDQSVDEQTAFGFTATASDVDLPANGLTFSLSGAPAGASITPGGVFSWTPTEAQGPGSYVFDVVVTDDGTPALADSETITVTVNEVNVAPVLDPVGDQGVDEQTALGFTATASDVDLPTNGLTFSLSGAPAGASITPGGVFSWTPTEAQGPGSYVFDVVVTDDGTPALADSETITVTVNEVNVAPAADVIADQTVDESTLLALTATASDADLPANTLTWSLDSGPGSVLPNGDYSWTPSEADGPGSYTVVLRVTDDGAGTLSDTVSFDVTVDEVNLAPVLDPVGNQSVDEQTALGFTATATDPDAPVNTLLFSLVGEPAGASIDPNTGDFSWTPTEAQGPGSYVFDVVVTDDGTPALADSETITVTVNEVNVAPVLGFIGNRAVDELDTLSYTAVASDADLPANGVTFSLVGEPPGASITPGGVFSWTPTEAQGPGSYVFDVVVTDDGTPALADSETITVTVGEDNLPPVLSPVGDQSINELSTLAFTATATDPDAPVNTLLFSLVGEPAGASIDPNTGDFSWTPTEAQGPGSYVFDVVVTDDGAPPLNDSETITVTVNEVNVAPVLGFIGNRAVDELDTLSYTAVASDADLPANGLTFSLVGEPPGASITPGGVFSWTPTEAQGPGSYVFDVVVTDDGTPALADSETITVTVNEVNVAPTLTSPGDQANAESDVVSVFAPASDPDLPVNGLIWSATGLPAGLSIAPATGEIAGTVDPLAAAGSPYSVTITVTDDGSPVLNDSVLITWTVTDTNRPPVLDPIGDRVVDEQVTLSFAATASDPDLDSYSFSLSGAPAGASITPGGGFSWSPSEAQGPGSYTFDVIVSDNGVPVLTDTETITVTVNEVNLPPVPDPIADYTFSEYTTLNLTASASDPDDPANSISWSIVSGPAGATLTPAGDFSWTADETHGGSTYTFTLRATDDGVPAASGDVSFDVTVTEDNQPPWALPIADVTIDEQVTFSFTATATDADIPANNLTWSLSSGPGFILPNGNYSWNPGEADGPGSYVVTLRVTDDGAGNLWDEEAFTVTVDEVNTPPTPDPIADRTLDELDTVTVNATATDSDIPANSLSWTLDSGPGAVTPGGVYSWTPTEADGPGTYSVTLRVIDDGTPSLSTPVTFDVTVNEVNNNAPVAVDDAYGATLEGDTRVVPAASGVLANDTDGDIPADPLSAVLVADVSHGVLALAADGSFTYTHDGSENHTDTFTYQVFDGANTSAPATVTLAMIPVSDQAPVAVDDSYGPVAEGGTLSVPPGGVLDNDYDGDVPAEPLTATVTVVPTHGALTLNADGSFSYDHDGTENFTDTFEYEVSDGLDTDTGTVSITIDPVNDNPPVAFDGSYVLDEGATLAPDAAAGVLGSASDVDGDPLTATLVTAPVHGTLALLADGSFTYVHDGTENFLDGFTFEVTDGVHIVGPLSVMLSINPVNDVPAIDPAAFSVLEDAPVGTMLGTPPATDGDGDPLVYSFVAAVPEFSIASLTGEISTAAMLDFETVASYSVAVTVTDPSGASATADVSIIVLDVDQPPVGAPAAFPIVEDLPLGSTVGVVAGSDPEGEPVTFALTGGDPTGRFVMDPASGELILVAPLDADVTPSYLLDVEVSDPGGNVAPVAVIVIVNPALDLPPINAAPLGVPDVINLFEDGTVLVSPLLNDTDPDGDALLISWIDSPVNGTLTPRGDGTFTYRPNPNFSGTETLSYGITDGRGGAGTATVVLGISPLNDAPVTPDVFVSLEFQPELLIPTPAIFDPDGDAISIVLGEPAVGAVELVAGAFLYRPEREWNGTDTFPYTATDSHGATSSGLVTVLVVQLDGDLVAIDLVTVEPLPEPDPGPPTGIIVDSIKLLVGTVTEMAGLLSVPILAVGIAFLSSILFGLSRNFLIGRGPVFLPATVPSSVAIVRVPDGGVVTALEGPGEEYPLVHRYGPAERGIRSTGRRAQRGSTVWVEIETPSGDAWVIERLTTREVPPGEFAADDAVADLIDNLGVRIEARGDLRPLVSKYGLEVAYYALPKHIGEGELESLLKGEESWGWWDPTGSTPSVRGEFVNMVADPLRRALESYDGLPVAEAVVPIPVELINFPHLTFSAADKLGWRIFVDYDGDTPKLAAIWREGVTNPSSI